MYEEKEMQITDNNIGIAALLLQSRGILNSIVSWHKEEKKPTTWEALYDWLEIEKTIRLIEEKLAQNGIIV